MHGQANSGKRKRLDLLGRAQLCRQLGFELGGGRSCTGPVPTC